MSLDRRKLIVEFVSFLSPFSTPSPPLIGRLPPSAAIIVLFLRICSAHSKTASLDTRPRMHLGSEHCDEGMLTFHSHEVR